jgi:hypothetical protein
MREWNYMSNLPATEHVKFAGYTVPVYEDMYSGEIEQLELLMQRAQRREITDYRLDLECFLVCARFRVPEYRRLTAEDFANLKMSTGTRASLREKVGVLIAPFVAMQHELKREQGLELLRQLTPEKLLDVIQQQEVTLHELRQMYAEAIGTRSAGDSATPTA